MPSQTQYHSKKSVKALLHIVNFCAVHTAVTKALFMNMFCSLIWIMLCKTVQKCLACQVNGQLYTRVCQQDHGRSYALTVIGYRYPEFEIIANTLTRSIIPKVGSLFPSNGIPENIKSDNSPHLDQPHYGHMAFVESFIKPFAKQYIQHMPCIDYGPRLSNILAKLLCNAT